jgi:hypothetical protein
MGRASCQAGMPKPGSVASETAALSARRSEMNQDMAERGSVNCSGVTPGRGGPGAVSLREGFTASRAA